MSIKKIFSIFIVILVTFSACNNQKKENKGLMPKKSMLEQKNIDNLSKVFAYGDKLNKEKKSYQEKIKKLFLEIKKIKNPFSIKEKRKYKYAKVVYLSNSIWTLIFPTEKMLETKKLFTVIVSYRANLDNKAKKTYNKKFMGYNAKYLKDKWVWILLDNNIEIRVTANKKFVQSDEKIKELLNDFDIEAMKSIFDENTKYPKVKEYLLEIKKLYAKINHIIKKFKEDLTSIHAIMPFLITDTKIMRELDLREIHFMDNTISIPLRKNKKIVLFIHIGKASNLGILTYFKDKSLKHIKIGDFPTTIVKNNMVIVRCSNLAVKISAYMDNEFKDTSKLLEIATSIDLIGLSKVK